MSATWTDPFTRADGALGSIPAGTYTLSKSWEIISGSWTIVSNRAASSTIPGSNPIVAITTGRRSNGRCDQDVSIDPVNFYGCAVYARLVDATNWLRCRSNVIQQTGSYYPTEYEYKHGILVQDYRQYLNQKEVQPKTLQYQMQNRTLQRQVSYWNGTCTTSAFGPWQNTGTLTGCQSSPPATPAPGYHSACPTQQYAYRYVVESTAGCAAGQSKYRLQVAQSTQTLNYSTKWVNDGYTLGANESFTGSTQYVNSGSPYWSNSNTANGTTIIHTGSTQYVDSGAPYWAPASTATSSTLVATGATRVLDNGLTPFDTAGPAPANTTDITWQISGSTYLYYYPNASPYLYYWSSTGPTSQYDATTGNTRTSTTLQSYTYYNYYLTLEKSVAGTVTQLGSLHDHGGSLTQLRLRAVGDAIEVYKNGGGTPVITATDAAHKTTGAKCGFGGGASSYNPQPPNIESFTAVMVNPDRIKNADGVIVEAKRRVRIGSQWIDVDGAAKA